MNQTSGRLQLVVKVLQSSMDFGQLFAVFANGTDQIHPLSWGSSQEHFLETSLAHAMEHLHPAIQLSDRCLELVEVVRRRPLTSPTDRMSHPLSAA